jgi:hypothetical protein
MWPTAWEAKHGGTLLGLSDTQIVSKGNSFLSSENPSAFTANASQIVNLVKKQIQKERLTTYGYKQSEVSGQARRMQVSRLFQLGGLVFLIPSTSSRQMTQVSRATEV